ncbi:LGFP repeat-containing protein [Mycobacterium sp. MMS18-G62]
MSGRSTVLVRAAIGLLAVGVAVLLAPVAAATPESDANDAINAAYDGGGGPTGALGPKDGDVYPVGEGFGQNFAGGKIFFTPATGAHIMTGAILEKYESLGGPGDSDLGFPTIDEGPGRAQDSRNTTFSAADKPVIFWTPGTGARVVRGAINAAWDKLGGSAGQLGVPAEDEMYRGAVVSQKFTGGEISYDTKAKTFTTDPPELAGELAGLTIPEDPTSAINAARRAAGGALGPLGAAQGAPYPIGKDGLGQNFAGGKIFYSPATGANVVTGQVLAKYESVGGPQGDLGFPTSNEVDGGLPTESRMTSFAAEDQPVIFWTPDYGAVIVRGAMNAAWQKLDGAAGPLGAPIADQTESGDVLTQRFSGGVVSWDRSKNAFSTEPANLASRLAGLKVPGQDVPKEPTAPAGSNTKQHKWFAPNWWWLLALIPILVSVGLVAFAAVRNRRRGRDDNRLEGDDAGPGVAPYEPVTGGAGQQPAEDERAAALFGDRYAQEGLGSLPSSAASHDYPPAPMSLWGSPEHTDHPDHPDHTDHADDAVTAQEPAVSQESAVTPEPVAAQTVEDDPDKVDTTPTRVEHDPLTDTGRHARIVIEEPAPEDIPFRLPLEDSDQAPEGFPIKADTKSGLYWAPGSALYDDARAEIWFVNEEFARTNGFVRAN